MRKSRGEVSERQVHVMPEYAHLYREIPPNEWWPAWVMAERLFALAESHGVPPHERICDPSHFMFRGGPSRGPFPRDLRTRRTDCLARMTYGPATITIE